MKDCWDNTPIACSLTTAELREREAMLLAQFKTAVVETEELQDGFVFHLPGDAWSIKLVADLIVAERECCPFLTFKVVAGPNMGLVNVRVTGPAGAKAFLKTILCP